MGWRVQRAKEFINSDGLCWVHARIEASRSRHDSCFLWGSSSSVFLWEIFRFSRCSSGYVSEDNRGVTGMNSFSNGKWKWNTKSWILETFHIPIRMFFRMYCVFYLRRYAHFHCVHISRSSRVYTRRNACSIIFKHRFYGNVCSSMEKEKKKRKRKCLLCVDFDRRKKSVWVFCLYKNAHRCTQRCETRKSKLACLILFLL